MIDSDRTKRNGFKVEENSFKLDMRKTGFKKRFNTSKTLAQDAWRHGRGEWGSLKTFKVKWAGALSNLAK